MPIAVANIVLSSTTAKLWIVTPLVKFKDGYQLFPLSVERYTPALVPA
jgi:hypothetical protein